ncbi:MAG: hypothetical protein R2813_11265 [Flavobacteriales bacterium]
MGTGLIRELVWDSDLNVPVNLLNVFGLIIVSKIIYADFFNGLLPQSIDIGDLDGTIGFNLLEFGLAFVSVLIFFGVLDRMNGLLSFMYLIIRNNRISKGAHRSKFNHRALTVLSAAVDKGNDYLVNHFAVTKEAKKDVQDTFNNYDSIYYIQKLWFVLIMVAFILCNLYFSYTVFIGTMVVLVGALMIFTCFMKVLVYELVRFKSQDEA